VGVHNAVIVHHCGHEAGGEGVAIHEGNGGHWVAIPRRACQHHKEKCGGKSRRQCKEKNLRQQPPPKRVQTIGKETLRLHRRFIVQPVAVKLHDPRRSHHHTFWKAMIQDIKGKEH